VTGGTLMGGLARCLVSFIICDDELNPLEITEILGIAPDKSHKKGDPNTAISKKGKLLVFAPYNTGIWCIESKEEKHMDLEHHIKCLLLLLYPLKDKFTILSAKGYLMNMFCSVDTDGIDQPGFSISPNTILKLGELKTKLDVCIY